MNKFVLFIFLLIVSLNAFAGSPMLWGPSDQSLNLQSNIQLTSVGPSLKSGSANPTLVAQSGVIGSLYLNTTNGQVYAKQDNGTSTNWVDILNSSTGWSLLGNSGTNASTNFLGTTDAVDLVFRTNNTEKSRITSAGNFLVNSTIADGSIHMKALGTAYTDGLTLEAFGAGADRTWNFFPDTNGYFYFRNSNQAVNALIMSNIGNIGIGVGSPVVPLHIGASSNSTTPSTFSSGGASELIRNSDSTNGNFSLLGFQNSNTAYDSGMVGIHDNHNTAGTATGHLEFYTTSAGTNAKRAHLDATGLGIGNITPSQSLDVNGNARIRGMSVLAPVVSDVSGNLSTSLGTSDQVLVTNNAGTAYAWSLLTNANIAASGTANIARNKLASGTANHVVVNDGSGVMSSVAQIAGTQGGTGVSNAGNLTYGSNNLTFSTSGVTSLTLPTSGTLATLSGTETFSNKSFSDALTLSEISTPSNPAAGSRKLYAKSNGIYELNSAGVETQLGSGGGGGSLNIVTQTSNYTMSSSNDVVRANTNGGSWTLTLPAASGITKPFYIKLIGNNPLTITGTGSDTIEQDINLNMTVSNSAVTLIPNSGGTGYEIY